MRKEPKIREIRYQCRVCEEIFERDFKRFNPQFADLEIIRLIRCPECTRIDTARTQTQRGFVLVEKKPEPKNRVFGKVEVGNAE